VHICLLSTEIFAWGKYGGYGRATRMIGRELAKRGIKVSALIPLRAGQNRVEDLDGIQVFGYDIKNIRETINIFKDCQADIYHSEEPSSATYLVQLFHPDKKHIVTFRDTKLLSDWITEFRLPSLSKFQVFSNWLFEDNVLVHKAVRNADRCYVAANLLKIRAEKKYRLAHEPQLLPTPIFVPTKVQKAKEATVCYLARWDRRKRPVRIIDLAKAFPSVRFIIMGVGRNKKFDQELRWQMNNISNLEVIGFINQFESDQLSEILSKSWVLINTAAREGLPNAFLEACAYQCAILSEVDPDGFASNYGFCSKGSDYITGLKYLLEENRWQKLGNIGYEYVKKVYEMNNAIDQHIQVYNKLIEN
jgi:glycosyltransferase involved in cell wall biosynthesis